MQPRRAGVPEARGTGNLAQAPMPSEPDITVKADFYEHWGDRVMIWRRTGMELGR